MWLRVVGSLGAETGVVEVGSEVVEPGSGPPCRPCAPCGRGCPGGCCSGRGPGQHAGHVRRWDHDGIRGALGANPGGVGDEAFLLQPEPVPLPRPPAARTLWEFRSCQSPASLPKRSWTWQRPGLPQGGPGVNPILVQTPIPLPQPGHRNALAAAAPDKPPPGRLRRGQRKPKNQQGKGMWAKEWTSLGLEVGAPEGYGFVMKSRNVRLPACRRFARRMRQKQTSHNGRGIERPHRRRQSP